MRKKIAYILGNNYIPTGMAKIITQKINYLAKHTDYELHLITTEYVDKPMYYSLHKDVQIHNLAINFDEIDTMPILQKTYNYIIKQQKYKHLLPSLLKGIKADIVISSMRREINFLNEISDGSKKIGEIHFNKSNYREFNKPYFPLWLNRWITIQWRKKLIKEIKRLEAFVVLTHEDRKEWTELNNVHVIHNCIDTFPNQLSNCTEKKVVAVGRYTSQKGFDNLIESWKIVNSIHPDWQLHIYGSGNNEIYQLLANEKGLKEVIICHSATSNIHQKLQESSIYVLSSRFEGLPMVLLEAISCGLPIVSFACPCGPKDIITDGVNGYLVEPENIKALAERICHLIEDEELRKNMGKAARKRAEDFREEKIMQQWIDLFENIS